MTGWILILVTSYTIYLPSNHTTIEYSSKEACEAALVVAKRAYATVNRKSYCVSLADFTARERKKSEVERLKRELKEEELKMRIGM